ncbi:hypothetical protein [Rodentibacter caecimuris]|uniref:Lipoprotein n=1 Tax=Rodentibacter caecimuris TaxID=1796644 RepID=A0ABX3KW97_9PAST|nr:hypothetical protein BKG89_09500 [Rodentibacter heylii]
MNLRKILGCAVIAASLSACNLLSELQGEVQQASKIEYTPEQLEKFKKLDEQFENIKKLGNSFEFNGEKYVKQTLAVKGDFPRFLSLSVSEDRNSRKSILSDTSYLQNVGMEAQMTKNFLQKKQQNCALESLYAGNQPYYACSNNEFKRYIAVIYKEKNIVAYRGYFSYQQQLNDAEEKNIVKSLMNLPLDSIVR